MGDLFDLTGHVAVVTGGNGGIGLGLASGLADAGADVAIWGRDEAKNGGALAELRARGQGRYRLVSYFVRTFGVPLEDDVAARAPGSAPG